MNKIQKLSKTKQKKTNSKAKIQRKKSAFYLNYITIDLRKKTNEHPNQLQNNENESCKLGLVKAAKYKTTPKKPNTITRRC